MHTNDVVRSLLVRLRKADREGDWQEYERIRTEIQGRFPQRAPVIIEQALYGLGVMANGC